LYDKRRRTLFIVTQHIEPEQMHRITVLVDPLPRAMFFVNDLWTDFGGQYYVGWDVILSGIGLLGF